MKRATLKDVAAEVGTHVSTVSRVMNEQTRGLISPEVTEKVLAAAARLGFRPNRAAASLRTQRSHTIGVLITDMVNPAFSPLMMAIEHCLNQHHYVPLVASTDGSAERQLRILDDMFARPVDGVIFATSANPDHVAQQCRLAGVPLVMVFHREAVEGVPIIADDDHEGIRQAVDHLCQLGHQRIGHVGGPIHLSTARSRAEAFRREMKRQGRRLGQAPIVHASRYRRQEGRVACLELLNQPDRPSAIVAANDLLAMGCYDAIRQLGLRCPQDVSVVGYGDADFVDLLDPPLTTLHVHNQEIGEIGAQTLMNLIEHCESGPAHRLIAPRLVVRGSTGGLPG